MARFDGKLVSILVLLKPSQIACKAVFKKRND